MLLLPGPRDSGSAASSFDTAGAEETRPPPVVVLSRGAIPVQRNQMVKVYGRLYPDKPSRWVRITVDPIDVPGSRLVAVAVFADGSVARTPVRKAVSLESQEKGRELLEVWMLETRVATSYVASVRAESSLNSSR